MPLGDPHKSQKRKNYVLMAVLVALMALVYAITLMRMGGR